MFWRAQLSLVSKFSSPLTSGYPWSNPIRVNDFSLTLSLIGIFLYGLPGTTVIALGQNMGWTCQGWSSMPDIPLGGSSLSGQTDLVWYIWFGLVHMIWPGPSHCHMLHVTGCLGALRFRKGYLLYRLLHGQRHICFANKRVYLCLVNDIFPAVNWCTDVAVKLQ